MKTRPFVSAGTSLTSQSLFQTWLLGLGAQGQLPPSVGSLRPHVSLPFFLEATVSFSSDGLRFMLVPTSSMSLHRTDRAAAWMEGKAQSTQLTCGRPLVVRTR